MGGMGGGNGRLLIQHESKKVGAGSLGANHEKCHVLYLLYLIWELDVCFFTVRGVGG